MIFNIGQASAKPLRYFLLFLIFFTIIVLSLFINELNYNSARFVPKANFYEDETVDARQVRTVTVPKLHLANLKQESYEPKPRNSSNMTNENTVTRGGIPEYARKLLQQRMSSMKRIPRSKRLRDWAIYEDIPSKWPSPVHWPDTWRRPSAPSDPSGRTIPRGIVCNLTQLSDNLRPQLPEHFEKREFKSLPPRYSNIVQPWPAPTCGTLGMASPWKLIGLQKDKNAEKRKLWMLFIVKSAPGYTLNRQTVRETWGGADKFKNHSIFVLFVVGKSTNETINENMKKESKTFGDILECDFIDHYHMLPTKVLATFRWFLERDFDIQFFSMTDDDCLVNLPNVAEFFDKKVTTIPDYYKNVYCGYKHHTDGIPLRKKKWAVTKEQYSGKFYPTFCHGGLWTLARPLMHGIYCVSEITKIGDFFLEDVLLTGILREKLNFKATNIKRVVRRTTKEDKLLFFHGAPGKTAEVAHNAVIAKWKKWKRKRT